MPQAIASAQPLTQLLQAWKQGDDAALARLFDQAYVELKRVAAQRIAQISGNATLTPTELLHEAVVRVMGSAMTWQNRAHFFASISISMRAVLIDHARARLSDKRGCGAMHLTLGQAEVGGESGIVELLSLDAALQRLEQLDARSAAVLHLACFAGLDRREIAEVLQVSVQVVDRELRFAKSWLNVHLDTRL